MSEGPIDGGFKFPFIGNSAIIGIDAVIGNGAFRGLGL